MTITPPSGEAAAHARARQARLTKPAGALGRLEDVSVWMASVQGTCPPRPFTAPSLVILAGDHGIARAAGTSAYPPEVTAQMVANFVTGGAAANVLAQRVGATVSVVDVAVDADPSYLDDLDPAVAARRIRRGSGAVDREDAMTLQECQAALDLGRALANEQIGEGADIVIPGDMGIGNTAVAATLIAILIGTTADAVTGRGTGVDDDTWRRKHAAIARAIERGTPHAGDPVRLLATVGSADIAAMVGLITECAERGVPVLLDGIVSCSAALLGAGLAPGAAAWWAAGHRSTEPASALALAHLGLAPLLDLDLRLGEGTGALLALPLLGAAADTLALMATFESAGVSDREH